MPNGTDKINGFVAKVFDPTTKTYKPIYIAPDGTDKVQGDVFLSDSTTSTLDASSGMTAATPKAVATVQTAVNNKLDKTLASETQTVAGPVTFSKGLSGTLTGSLVGDADRASMLDHTVAISLDAGGTAATASTSFNGSSLTLSIPQIDASRVSKGTLPLSVIPQGALERLVKVANQAARYKLTSNDVQLGDSVLQTDTGVMYIVVDTDKLSSADGYQEYKAGTAVRASTADQLTTARKISLTGPVTGSVSFNGGADVSIATTIGASQVGTTQIADSAVTGAKVNFNYATSSSKGGAATSAETATKLTTARTFKLSGAVSGSASFNGTADASISTTLADKIVATAKLADSAVTSDKIAAGAVLNAKLGNLSVNTAKLADASNNTSSPQGVTTAKIENSAVSTAKIADKAVSTAKIADAAVGDAKLGSTVQTVYVGTSQPSESTYAHVRLWVVTDSSNNLTGIKVRTA